MMTNRLKLNQRKSDEEFRRRVLAALEKPSKKPIFALINSAFFLWILSAICIALGGSFFAQKQRCYSEAQPLTVAWFEIEREFHSRDDVARDAVKEASSLQEAHDLFSKYMYKSTEYSHLSYAQLIAKRAMILYRVDWSQTPELTQFSDIDTALIGSMETVSGPKQYQASFARLKQLTQDTIPLGDRTSPKLNVRENCSFYSVAHQLFTGNGKFLVAYYH